MRPKFGRNQIWGLVAVVVFFGGVTIGTLLRQNRSHPQPPPAATAPTPQPAPVVVQAPAPPAIPSAQQAASAPHPALEKTDDPPSTETSSHPVIEEEPAPSPSDHSHDQAMVTPPPAVTTPAGPQSEPPWKRYAVPPPATSGRKMVAVIIDDMGLDHRRSKEVLALPGPLTISFMSYAEDLSQQSAEAHQDGHEMIMHVPMEPLAKLDPGPGALLESLPPDEIRSRLNADLDRFKGYVGINNHMGSKFTAYAPGMDIVMTELKRRGLLFIDSLTSDKSIGLAEAHRFGVPTAARNVFLDDEPNVAAVNAQLAKLEELALRKGNAIAIGHPKDATIAALKAWIPTLAAKGLVLVPVSAIVTARMSPTQAQQQANVTRQSH